MTINYWGRRGALGTAHFLSRNGFQVSWLLNVLLENHWRTLYGEGAPQTQWCWEVVGGTPNRQENQGALPKVIQVVLLPGQCRRATLKHLQHREGEMALDTKNLSFLATTQPCLPTLKLAIIADVRIEGQENEGQLGQITHEEAR